VLPLTHPIATVALLATLLAPAVAFAQQPTPLPASPPLPAVIVHGPTQDPAAPAQDPLSVPLRLSMIPPSGGASPGGCGALSVDDAGTIFATQPHVQVQLTMRLTLETFSSLGCPGDPYAAFDSGAGAGFTYLIPLPRDFWVVASGGVYDQPSKRRTSRALGVDVVQKRADGTSTSLGIGGASTSRGVRVVPRVGGTF
jgi:hypothetical protein